MTIAALMLAMIAPLLGERAGDSSRAPSSLSSAYSYEVITTGRVQRVHAPRLFTVARRITPDRELLVFAPNAAATPEAGTIVTMRGMIRPFADTTIAQTAEWNRVDEAVREAFASEPVLVAMMVVTSTGRELAREPVEAPLRARSSSQEPRRSGSRAEEFPIAVAPAMLADHVATLAGHAVRIPNARVVGVFTPQAFLVESDMSLRPFVGNRARIVVFIDRRELGVAPETLVATNVTVSGIARTLLGMQVSRDVAWPPVLTRTLTEHLEIRAALLARSVRTAEGVDLTVPAGR